MTSTVGAAPNRKHIWGGIPAHVSSFLVISVHLKHFSFLKILLDKGSTNAVD